MARPAPRRSRRIAFLFGFTASRQGRRRDHTDGVFCDALRDVGLFHPGEDGVVEAAVGFHFASQFLIGNGDAAEFEGERFLAAEGAFEALLRGVGGFVRGVKGGSPLFGWLSRVPG